MTNKNEEICECGHHRNCHHTNEEIRISSKKATGKCILNCGCKKFTPKNNNQQKQTHDGIQAGNISQDKSESIKLESEKQSAKVGGAGLKIADRKPDKKSTLVKVDNSSGNSNLSEEIIEKVILNQKFISLEYRKMIIERVKEALSLKEQEETYFNGKLIVKEQENKDDKNINRTWTSAENKIYRIGFRDGRTEKDLLLSSLKEKIESFNVLKSLAFFGKSSSKTNDFPYTSEGWNKRLLKALEWEKEEILSIFDDALKEKELEGEKK
jgi:hypothetical protein